MELETVDLGLHAPGRGYEREPVTGPLEDAVDRLDHPHARPVRERHATEVEEHIVGDVTGAVDVAGVQARRRELHRADLLELAFDDHGGQVAITS